MEVSSNVESAFISVGCNRVVNAVSWGPGNLVAFGAHNSVAIFSPKEARILVTLPGHKDYVNCVLWLAPNSEHDVDGLSSKEQYLLSGSADGAIILWAYLATENKCRIAAQTPKAHDKAVTCIAALMVTTSQTLLSSTSSDSTVRVWNVSISCTNDDCSISLLQTIPVGSRTMVAVSLTALPGSQHTFLLALGGLDNHVHFYAKFSSGQFIPVCQIKGHQDWIRSLDFSVPVYSRAGGVVFLASSSQDKTIRIWKLSMRANQSSMEVAAVGLSLKTFIDGPIFKVGKDMWQVSLDSLLLGHEDWVYSVRWKPCSSSQWFTAGIENKLQDLEPMCVLSASMDRTMMIWKPDIVSGVWMNEVTVGELAQSALGFYGGVWSPHGDAILAYGYSGSFHLWKNMDLQAGEWQPQLAPSGHSAPVVDVAWAKTGKFFLSVSHDQTTRLFACWNWNKGLDHPRKVSWHEIGRPQVHGHNLSCLATVTGPGNHRFVSGADEKVARVFEAPGALLDSMIFTTGGREDSLNRNDIRILGANMSALGLSQKPIYAQDRKVGETKSAITKDCDMVGLDSMGGALTDAVPTILTEPPLEEHLAQNTLWPESHKLYGHGNELFAMCCDHGGKFVATACKAQSATFAQIWLWCIGSWRPVNQLKSHTLTVTQMEFSHNDRFLLSVSRDRHLSVFELTENDTYKLLTRIDAHKRIIWTCSWSHCDRFFATGSRDKVIKIWSVFDTDAGVEVCVVNTLPVFKSSVTALAWGPELLLAIGMEDGTLELWKGCAQDLSENDCQARGSKSQVVGSSSAEQWYKIDLFCLEKFNPLICHVATVHRLSWRDVASENQRISKGQEVESYKDPSVKVLQLVSCGSDYAIRLFNIKVEQKPAEVF